MVKALLMRYTIPELREELVWRSLPVSGVKEDLIGRLLDARCARTWTHTDGVQAAAWAERLCGTKIPLNAFRSDKCLAEWFLKYLPNRRR